MDHRKFLLRKLIRFVLVISYIALIAVLVYFFTHHSPEQVIHKLKHSPYIGLIVLALAYCLKSITFVIPVLLLFVIAGALLPTPIAIIFTYVLIALEFSLTFQVGKRLGSDKIRDHLKKSKAMRKLLEMDSSKAFMLSILLRFVPFLSLDLVSLLLSTTQLGLKSFLLGSLIGVTPNIMTFIFMGEAISDPTSIEFLIPVAIKVIFTGIMFLYYKKSKRFNQPQQ